MATTMTTSSIFAGLSSVRIKLGSVFKPNWDNPPSEKEEGEEEEEENNDEEENKVKKKEIKDEEEGEGTEDEEEKEEDEKEEKEEKEKEPSDKKGIGDGGVHVDKKEAETGGSKSQKVSDDTKDDRPDEKYGDDSDEDENSEDEDSEQALMKLSIGKLRDKMSDESYKLSVCTPYVVADSVSKFDFIHVNGAPLPLDEKALLAMCKRSPFGDLSEMKTRIDTAVRDAFEIKPSPENVLELTPRAQQWMNKAANIVSERMFGGNRVKVRINKINVYPVGGHFCEHIDTPRPGVLASLVVRLPYMFTGGEFSIRYMSDDTPVKIPADHIDSTLQLIAFLCESPHKIDTVRSGIRVTLSAYLVSDTLNSTDDDVDGKTEPSVPIIHDHKSTQLKRKVRPASNDDDDDEDAKEDDLLHKRVKVVSTNGGREETKGNGNKSGDIEATEDELTSDGESKQPRWVSIASTPYSKYASMPSYKLDALTRLLHVYFSKTCTPVAFLLRHSYSDDQFHEKSFKGADVGLMKVLNHKRYSKTFSCVNLPVIVKHYESGPPSGIERSDSEEGRSMEVYRFTEYDFDAGDITEDEKKLPDNIEFFGADNWSLISKANDRGAAYTGNDSRDRSYQARYFAHAVIITRPGEAARFLPPPIPKLLVIAD